MDTIDGGMPIWFKVLFIIVVLFIALVILSIIFKGIKYSRDVHNSPQEKIEVKVASKRTEVSGGAGDSMASTWYYATFENLLTNERFELGLRSKDYSMLSEGDTGILEHKGPKFINFERNISK